jgi:hypothetical protein
MNTWQLPEGVDELTGDRALAFECVRRQLIDLYTDKGFGLSNTATFPKLSTIGSIESNFKLSSINTITSIAALMLLEPYNSAPA